MKNGNGSYFLLLLDDLPVDLFVELPELLLERPKRGSFALEDEARLLTCNRIICQKSLEQKYNQPLDHASPVRNSP